MNSHSQMSVDATLPKSQSTLGPELAAAPIQISTYGDEASSQPLHFYAAYETRRYGYEQAPRAGDLLAGKKPALLWWQYLGQKDGLFQVMHMERDFRTIAEGRRASDMVTIYKFDGPHYLGNRPLRLGTASVVGLVLADAMNGRLMQRIGRLPDGLYTFWVDATEGRLVVHPQATSGVNP